MDTFALWIAQGLGVGRIPIAPGTFGSLLGFAWFFLLLGLGDPVLFTGGAIGGIALSIWSAGRAEKILGKTDPGSVVIDEIIAIPFCFAGLLLTHRDSAQLFHPAYFQNHIGTLVAIFIAFRIFDILKPWPINRSQRLRAGWGITIDDLIAAAYANLIWLVPIFRT
ncbi:MAG: phosphatidylglycerophosphatase [Verrucomicrobiales bacterium]|jgi:phosphatidylglycerophosphatase A|nr:phosphatidylglycerophosphatase [Verrucomicrobiales bacterium]